MTGNRPTPDEAAQALDEVRRQQVRLRINGGVPRWLMVALFVAAAVTVVGIGLAKDLLDPPTRTVVMLAGVGVLACIVAIVALTTRGVGARRLGFRAVPASSAGQKLMNVVVAVALLLPAILVSSFLLPALHLPFPNTSNMVFWIGYTAVVVVIVVRRMARQTRTGSGR